MSEETVLSSSSVSTYFDCHYQWYLRYVERLTGEQNVPAATGLAVHAAVERYYKDLLLFNPEHVGDLDWAALDAFDYTFMTETLPMADPDEDLAKAREVGRRVVRAYLEDVAPGITPVWVEHGGRVIINGIEYSYHIDLVDSEDRIRDLKVLKSKIHHPADKLSQLVGYALGFRAETGRVESDVMLDVMIRLKRDRPYHVPYRYGGPVSDLDIGKFAARLEGAAEGIAAHDYSPTGLDNGSCSWCGVRAACSYYGTLQEIEREPAP